MQRRIRSRVLRLAVRPGLERLLRYCARPAFASERLSWDGSDHPVRYRLTKPLPTGQTESEAAGGYAAGRFRMRAESNHKEADLK